ncbi:glucose-1-phosphate adenylyltransferase family protein [Sphingobium sp. B2D3C]|uniref:glucose-1-phosphate adenylyltransferase family protein n=1 Tax=Sphingobium sp. B2D3C TaxID=2940581 RepID=UPI0022259C60|nr:sugar phosphate nucleotidyltransferase [Sphingobium sp. B2D3C]MCW2399339.1 glucose-1-phosphate adenylyltransferase [Sphingobium sp. B2D3C]
MSQSNARHATSAALALVLAGGRGSRLHDLTSALAKPALPVGDVGRLIDFTLANVANSGIPRALVLTQYEPDALHRHLNQTWQRFGGIELDVLDGNECGPFNGTADAVVKISDQIDQEAPDHVVVLAGDHLYQMDYRPFIERHMLSNAKVTVGAVHVPLADADQFGVMTAGADGLITDFAEKPASPAEAPDRPGHAFASMGIYVFTWQLLRQVLVELAPLHEDLDFGKHVLPRLVAERGAYVYALPGRGQAAPLWRDLGTVDAYHGIHADIASGRVALDPSWPVAGRRAIGLPVRSATVSDRPAWPGHMIGQGASVGERAQLRNVVVMPGARVGSDVRIDNAIVTGDAVIPDGFDLSAALRQCGDSCLVSEGGIRLLSAQAMSRLAGAKRSAKPHYASADESPRRMLAPGL